MLNIILDDKLESQKVKHFKVYDDTYDVLEFHSIIEICRENKQMRTFGYKSYKLDNNKVILTSKSIIIAENIEEVINLIAALYRPKKDLCEDLNAIQIGQEQIDFMLKA